MPNSNPQFWLIRQRIPTANLRFRDLKSETRWLLWFAVLYIGVSAVTGVLILSFPLPLFGATYFTLDTWYVVGFKFAALLTLPLVVYHRWGYRLRDLLYGWHLTPRAAFVLVLSYAAGFFVNASRISEMKAAYAMHAPLEAMARTALGFALPWLMAGIPEEVVYRGMLQTRLEASWGRVLGIIVSVTLFTAWHIPTRFFLANSVEGKAGDIGSVLWGTGLPVAIVAVIFALAWDRWRNLPALIAIHSGVDTLPITCSILQSTAESFR